MRLTTKSLGEVCEIGSSKRIYASEYKKSGVPFYRGREIIERQKGKLQLSAELFISEEKYNDIISKFGAPKTGDLLLTSVGTLGIPYVVRSTDKFYFKDGNLTWFKNFKGLLGDYLYYWLLSPYGKAELKKATIGSSQSAFTIVLLKRLKIQVPPLEVQKIISGRIKAYDDLIENNSKRIEKLEAMAHLLYCHYFDNSDSIENVTKISEAFQIQGGGTPSKADQSLWDDGDIDWYTPSDLTKSNSMFIDSSTDKINAKGLSKSSAKLFDSFCVMLTSRATIGAISINTTPATTNQGFITCIPNDKTGLYYLYFWLKSNVDEFELKASGATFKEISKGVFKTIDFQVPKAHLLTEFESKVEAIAHLILNLQRKNQKLAKARDLLLPRLMSGEIDA